MRSIRKDLKIASIAIIALLFLAQTIRIEKTNPPAHSEMAADLSIQPLLKRACYNCHSNETVWPWYSNVAPASWLVGSDVKEARRRLNFSEWGLYGAATQEHKLVGIKEEVEEKGMPPWYYSMMHPDARITQDDRNVIRGWTASAVDLLSPKP
jgi:hypothetical protein